MDYPTEARVATVYREIFGPEWTIQKLAHSAIQGHLLQKAVHGPPHAEVVGRSIVWKLMLAADSPLDASTGLRELKRLRSDYVRLLKDSIRAPDGTFPESLVVPGEPEPPRRTSVDLDLAQNNPLSLDESNPWKEYFASLELRKTIQKDVERTFPDVEYFRSARAQRMLADILFVYSRTHEGISYRQGMHELLAPVLWALDYDSLDGKGQGQDADMFDFLSRDYVPADAWAIFSRVMEGAGSWYEWREPKPAATGGPPPTPWVAPINELCSKVGGEYLAACDPALCSRMNELGIEPQMYGIRWLRLLFTREFPWRDALMLWDALFGADPSLQVVPWVCVAMLIRIRNLLIPAEYTTALTYLLRYPSPPSSQTSSSDVDSPLPLLETHLLVQQALMLRANPSPSTGATIVLQNRSVLGIAIEAPSPPPPQQRRGGRRRSIGSGTDSKESAEAKLSSPKSRPAGISRHIPEGSLTGFAALNSLGERADVIAKGIWDIRGQVGNRVSEIRKNLPELVRTPSMSGDTHVFPYYQAIQGAQPDSDEGSTRPSIADTVRRSMEGLVRPSAERQPSNDARLPVPANGRPPRTRFEVEREVGDMRALMRRLGDGVGAAIELLNGESNESKEEALKNLAYIQQVLAGVIETGSVGDDKILGPTEIARRREQIQANQDKEDLERQLAETEAEAGRAREEQEREREKERLRKLEEQRAVDPLQASPSVKPTPLVQTSPPRIRTTQAPWGRSDHFPSLQSGLSSTGNPAPQKDGNGIMKTKREGGGNDPLGAGLLG
ncbi:TBC1 domain family, member 5 [Rhizoctonia solani AG-1 IB]|uniref:TBC1 domain family, member 5 n=1 Tax=Thanatephorus cucumeris (strain AG1-IB / isolate 7/3/14) TaxID=1108050 RepID=M5BIL3_THACB|nr:TBC1 domain family, member 5 [Rhizoctonia solani AG-1 IB]